MPSITNSTEADWLDTIFDRYTTGGRYRLAIFDHSSGTANTLPNGDGSLPSGLAECALAGYSSPAINSTATEWASAVPGDSTTPTTKSGPASGQWSYGTLTAAHSGSTASVCQAIIDKVTRTSVSCTTTNGSSTVTVSGTTVTNADLGRAVGATTVGSTPSGSIAIPTGAVIGAILSSTSFTMYKNNAAVTAANGTNGTAGTASITLGEIIKHAWPYYDTTTTTTSSNMGCVANTNVITLNSALSGSDPGIYEGAAISFTGAPSSAVVLFVSADMKTIFMSKTYTGSTLTTGSSAVTLTLTGKVIAKTYAANDNPVVDGTNPMVLKVGGPRDPF